MMEAEERRKLISRYCGESSGPLTVVLRCAAALIVLVIMAAGPWAFLGAGGTTAATGAQPASKPAAATAASKRESRRTHESARHGGTSQADNATRTRFVVE